MNSTSHGSNSDKLKVASSKDAQFLIVQMPKSFYRDDRMLRQAADPHVRHAYTQPTLLMIYADGFGNIVTHPSLPSWSPVSGCL